MPLDWDALILQKTQNVFGENVFWMPRSGGASYCISGIFDEGFNRGDISDGSMGFSPMHVTTSHPILGCRAAAFPTPPQQGDHVTIRGSLYIIQEIQPDSHGALHLVLNEAKEGKE